ncbi:hypothetical protein L0156_02150 [bacterium]|nr:hypothetical protein [bacterium]
MRSEIAFTIVILVVCSLLLFPLITTAQINLASPLNYNAGAIPEVVAVGDLDGDGDDDLAIINRQGHLRILINNGAGCFDAFLNYENLCPTRSDGVWPGFRCGD